MDKVKQDGIHGMLPAVKMPEHVKKFRAVYSKTPNAPIFHAGSGVRQCIGAWRKQGLPLEVVPGTDAWNRFFSYDPAAEVSRANAGWTEASFYPAFDEEVLETRPDGTLLKRDTAGRKILVYNDDRALNIMPMYVDHPVKDMKTWEKDVKWRLDFGNAARQADIKKDIPYLMEKASQGYFMQQRIIGCFMYLRSLIGPEELLVMFYDSPELIHACLETWYELSDAILANTQTHISLDEIFFGEDICYNHGPLISPEMIQEFLMPYYVKLVGNARRRQMDQQRHLFIQLDTDGKCMPVIDVYAKNIGMDVMSPFEVASGCDVVQVGRDHPDLIMRQGIDKRILAKSKKAVDTELERIIPAMKARGGYIPGCDHGIPENVSLENYLHYRKRMVELGR